MGEGDTEEMIVLSLATPPDRISPSPSQSCRGLCHEKGSFESQ